MLELRELYQEIILDHNKNPHNYYEMESSTHKSEGYNPLCGDRYTIYLRVHNDKIDDISFQGAGCAISKSSASIMTDVLKGKNIEEAKKLNAEFNKMLTEDTEVEIDLQSQLGKATVLCGVKAFPSRLKCATLAWHTLKSALNKEVSTSTE